MGRKSRSERSQLELFRALPGDLAPRGAGLYFAPDGGHTLRNSDLRWPWHQRARLRSPHGRSRPVAGNLGAYVDPSAGRTAATSLFLDQRMEGDGRRQWAPNGSRTNPARLVLCRRLDGALVLTMDRANFGLTGGLERWLYRLVCKHRGRQQSGWSFDFLHLLATCHWGPVSVLSACQARSSHRSSSNQKSFDFLLTDRAVFLTVHNPPRELLARLQVLDLGVDGAAS